MADGTIFKNLCSTFSRWEALILQLFGFCSIRKVESSNYNQPNYEAYALLNEINDSIITKQLCVSLYYVNGNTVHSIVQVSFWVPPWNYHGLHFSSTVCCSCPNFIIAFLREINYSVPVLPGIGIDRGA